MTDEDRDDLAARFDGHRPRLRAVAFRMLGSVAEADDAVQDTWLRLDGADADAVTNLEAWLTTVTARVCLNRLRARENRREDPLDVHVPDPVVDRPDAGGPESEALLADAVGLALLVVLDELDPPERLAFVLHDMFAVPFEEIAPLVERSPGAARQLASRARRRVRGHAPAPDPDLARQRDVVDAFFAAARDGEFDALLAVLHPDVVLRADGGGAPRRTFAVSGARAVAERALTTMSARLFPHVRAARVNGTAGAVVAVDGTPLYVLGFTVTGGTIRSIDILADPERLRRVDGLT